MLTLNRVHYLYANVITLSGPTLSHLAPPPPYFSLPEAPMFKGTEKDKILGIKYYPAFKYANFVVSEL